MSWFRPQIKPKVGFLSYHSHNSLVSPSVPPLPYNNDYQKQASSGNKISPAILFIIVILAVLFFISGLLHLLVRYIIRHRSSSSMSDSSRYPDMSGSDAFQRQLQQLFHLHDSGLAQAFIDALPVFQYKEIMGLKDPFDCAVCLCEFTEKDKLRLLPMCSHAFHIDCIDTWLLSNSTCPLCRGTLFAAGLPIENPVFDSEEPIQDDSFSSNAGNGVNIGQKPLESDRRINSRRVFSIRLGKFRSSNSNAVESGEVAGEGETSTSNLDARRCYSMGSYQYVVADELQVALYPNVGTSTGNSVKIIRGRNAENGNSPTEGDVDGKKINIRSKGESFSVSKIWQWSKKGKFPSSSDTHLSSSANDVSLPWRDRVQGT